MQGLFDLLFGGGRNAVAETVEVFRTNAEKQAARDHESRSAALQQFAAEFATPRRGLFDRVIDGLNRVPRPAMAMGTLGLFVAAMVDPVWFSARMQGLALVPEPLWWLLGAVVSFYFGARHQAKSQEFQHSLAATLARTPDVARGIRTLDGLRAESGAALDPAADADTPAAQTARALPGSNAALSDWRGRHGER